MTRPARKTPRKRAKIYVESYRAGLVCIVQIDCIQGSLFHPQVEESRSRDLWPPQPVSLRLSTYVTNDLTMKTAVAFLALFSGASAFAPSASIKAPSALKASDYDGLVGVTTETGGKMVCTGVLSHCKGHDCQTMNLD